MPDRTPSHAERNDSTGRLYIFRACGRIERDVTLLRTSEVF